MKLTKTWLSYIIWGIFSIIFFTNIGIAAIEIGIQNETTDFLMPMVILYGGTIVGILAFIGVYKLIEKYVLPKMKSDGEAFVLKGPGEWLAFAMVIFVAIAIRVIAIISAGGALTGTTEFYEYAIGSADSTVFAIHNNATYIYCGILGFLLSFLGHFPTAAMSVQAGIQIITIVVSFFTMRKALGRLPAWVAIILISFLPGSFLAVRTCMPDSFLTMLFAVFMLGLVYLGQANREQKIRIGAHGLFYVLIGIFSGILIYLDWTGLLAFVIGVVALVQYKNEDAWLKIQKPFLQVLWFSISGILTVLLMLWFLPTGTMEVGPAAIVGFLHTLVPSGGLNLMIMSPHKGQWDTLALFIFSGLWFAGFLRNKQDRAFPYTFIIVFLTIASFFGIGVYDFDWMASYVWIMLSTIGITSINDFRKTERDVAVAEKTKENNAKRKAERERKRAEAAGEKSISLEEIHKKNNSVSKENDMVGMPSNRVSNTKTVQSNTYVEGSAKKGYGIGRKAEVVADAENIIDKSETNPPVNETFASTSAPVIATSAYSGVTTDEKYSVVKKVDRPPLGMPASLTPMQPQYGYSSGNRSRRSLRSPSKSTFTPEDLERISRYTGVNYMASQTVSVSRDEQDVIEESLRDGVVSEGVVETNIVSEDNVQTSVTNLSETVVIEETSEGQMEVSSESAIQNVNVSAEDVTTTYDGKTENVESVEVELKETEKEHSIGYIELDEEQNVDEGTDENKVSVVEEKPTLAPYVSPSRRHFRHPSKSTFTPEELEKISQYTGVSYKKAEPSESPNKMSDDNKKDEKTQEIQTESKTVQPENVSVQSERNVSKVYEESKTSTLDSVKSNPERKPKMIRNPLPGPKPHVAKELNYDYNPKPSEMEFDIVDLKGKDFFDL